ncbi:hypothetical protein OEZ85_000702 [Tetradesmus obliquus]|uniref:RRM domain-containing protein n=1 Tax=Tetradesmus obliquus TaxID=3088 RepID=A0ABY8UPF6_TETOB|nr:hypothetical protein OEZ85_000702 [Tetradesmus obliquus]
MPRRHSYVDEAALLQLFSICGRVHSLWIVRSPASKASLGYGYVVYEAGCAQRAVQRAVRKVNGQLLQQQTICVRESSRAF